MRLSNKWYVDPPYTAQNLTQLQASGIAPPSFVANILDQYHSQDDLTADDEEDIQAASTAFYAGTMTKWLSHI